MLLVYGRFAILLSNNDDNICVDDDDDDSNDNDITYNEKCRWMLRSSFKEAAKRYKFRIII